MRAGLTIAAVAAVLATAGAGARGQTRLPVDTLLVRVGDRLTEYYKRAQNVICIEKSTVQPLGGGYSPEGFARTVESELHVEAEEGSDEPKIVREVRKVNGRVPRDKDKKERAACTDPNPLSTEPLAFLLPSHRAEYEFTVAGADKEKGRATLLIDFTSTSRKSNLELREDPLGREGCFQWTGDVPMKGRIWVDSDTYDVVRVDQRFGGPVDIRVPATVQRRYNFSNWVLVERYNVTIRYRTIAFHDPDEALLLPESIDSLMVLRGGLESTRRTQTFADYHRFVTAGRIVK